MPAPRLARLLPWVIAPAVLSAAPASPLDRDANSLDDVWEAAHAQGAALAPAADLDGDGFDARAESLAGTDPRDAASAPRLLAPEWLPGDLARLRWPTVRGKRYTLHLSDGMAVNASSNSTSCGREAGA